jgi:hypothetical protein
VCVCVCVCVCVYLIRMINHNKPNKPNAGLFLWQVSALIAAWSPNFNCLLAARLLSGVGQAFVFLKKKRKKRAERTAFSSWAEFVRVNIYMYAWCAPYIHIHVCVCVCVCVFVCVCVCIYASLGEASFQAITPALFIICMCIICMYVCVYVCMCVCMCVCIHTYTHIHTYTSLGEASFQAIAPAFLDDCSSEVSMSETSTFNEKSTFQNLCQASVFGRLLLRRLHV